MLKKISVFFFLFSLSFLLISPSIVKAGNENSFSFDRETKMLSDGLGNSFTVSSIITNRLDSGMNLLIYGSKYSTHYSIIFFLYDSNYNLAIYPGLNTAFFLLEDGSFVSSDVVTNSYYVTYTYYINTSKLSSEPSKQSYDTNGSSTQYGGIECLINAMDFFIYSDVDILNCNASDSSALPVLLDTYYYQKPVDLYTFEEWCTDAGLSCSASKNESSSVIPFFYEPDNYNYIVSKNLTASSTSGVYNLLMIQKSDGAHYPYHFQVSDIDYLGIAGAFADINIFTVRKFYYDPDGEGWKLIMRHDISELPFDHTDFTFDENTVFIYSDTDIYSDRAASSVWQSASKEYYNVDIPTPAPTSIPSSGGGRPGSGTRPDTGGQVTGGSGLDFIINLFTLIWTKICAIPMSVDGYSISLQQIIVYGALVTIVGGFIMHFIFGRK